MITSSLSPTHKMFKNAQNYSLEILLILRSSEKTKMPNSTIPEIPANTKCQLVDGFAIVVQLALAVVAFSSLICMY